MKKRIAKLLRKAANRIDPLPKPASWVNVTATWTCTAYPYTFYTYYTSP